MEPLLAQVVRAWTELGRANEDARVGTVGFAVGSGLIAEFFEAEIHEVDFVVSRDLEKSAIKKDLFSQEPAVKYSVLFIQNQNFVQLRHLTGYNKL